MTENESSQVRELSVLRQFNPVNMTSSKIPVSKLVKLSQASIGYKNVCSGLQY